MRTVLRAGKPSDFYCTARNTLLMVYLGALCKAFTNSKITNQGKLYTLDLYPSTVNAHETHTFVIIIIIKNSDRFWCKHFPSESFTLGHWNVTLITKMKRFTKTARQRCLIENSERNIWKVPHSVQFHFICTLFSFYYLPFKSIQ